MGSGRLKRIIFGLVLLFLCFLLTRLASSSDQKERIGEPGPTYQPPVFTTPSPPSQLSTAHERPSTAILGLLRSALEASKHPHDYCRKKITLAQQWQRKFGKHFFVKNSWENFYARISSCTTYDGEDFDAVIRPLLADLKNRQITAAKMFKEGTQVKLKLTMEGGLRAVWKPKRFNREFETDPNHFYFSDFERHNAEIAAFHLDRVLGLYRATPTTARLFNLSSEIQSIAHYKLNKTFFTSPSENLCFAAKCDYYCDTTHAICGAPFMKEASVQVWLPDEDLVPRHEQRSPYKRTYSKHSPTADWQEDDDFCTDTVHDYAFFAHGRTLHDLIELHVYDFLMGNQDRHHFETFQTFFDGQTHSLFLDQGRAFGRSYWDDLDILKPLTQCCLIRPAFLARLLELGESSEGVSGRLRAAIAQVEGSPFLPILAEKHYKALDRRMVIILKAVAECIRERGADKVITNEFHNPRLKEGEGELLESSKSEE